MLAARIGYVGDRDGRIRRMGGAQYALAALVGERPDAAERRRSQRRQVALTVLIGVLSLVLCGSISGGSISANPAGRGR
jgi:hypothetical protein